MHLQSARIKRLCTIVAMSAAVACDAASAAPGSASNREPPPAPVQPSAPKKPMARSTSPARSGSTQEASIPDVAPTTPAAIDADSRDPIKSAASPRDRFTAFWDRFRTAIERNDTETLSALTRFPFETRGEDHHPVRKHNPARFVEILDRLLAEDAGQHEPVTMRELILRTPEISGNRYVPDIQASLGSFLFSHTKDGWRFTRAYTEMFEPDYVPTPRLPSENP
jgi:hypothetical protein